MRVSGSVLMSLIFLTYLYLPMIGLTLHTDLLMRTDLPEPLGKPVVTMSNVDANLMHDLTTVR
jgi:hypothetical protein